MVKDKGLLVVLSGPSGVGKGTVRAALRDRNVDFEYSVSATTRLPREGEEEGVNYFFKTKQMFEEMIANNEFLEWAQYTDRYYGTPRAYVEERLAAGKDVFLEIEVQGALQVKQQYSEGVFIFLMPPSMDELKDRIVNRGTDTKADIQHRMNIAQEELDMIAHYDYIVVNDEVEAACDRIQAIMLAEHCRKDRLIHKYDHLLSKGGH